MLGITFAKTARSQSRSSNTYALNRRSDSKSSITATTSSDKLAQFISSKGLEEVKKQLDQQ